MSRQSKTELYAALRRDVRAGLSIRAVMRKHGVSHPTVRKALESAWPRPRKKMAPRASLLDPFKPVIDAMLGADLDAPCKQRHTVKRIFDRLVDEHGAQVSYGIVLRYVAERRPQIRVEAGRGPVEAYIPQTHRPGAEAEVDFGDVTVRIGGQQVTCYLCQTRGIPGSRRTGPRRLRRPPGRRKSLDPAPLLLTERHSDYRELLVTSP
ncbi:hypothetical protein ACFY05_40090 [Microtetraspora fusca]|uniref:HTH IS21-type domain-containing protein n=1 Tax=Microtetraspora fusca TaxID=1997 RepID=A0ABW6VKB2_MICFU